MTSMTSMTSTALAILPPRGTHAHDVKLALDAGKGLKRHVLLCEGSKVCRPLLPGVTMIKSASCIERTLPAQLGVQQAPAEHTLPAGHNPQVPVGSKEDKVARVLVMHSL